MNQTSDIAQNLLANPPPELQRIMDDPRTTDEARQAVKDVSSTSTSVMPHVPKSVNGAGEASNRGGRLQIVNEHQEFTKELSPFLDKWGLLDKGFAYDVVSVFGSQSTGKSTLLNRLFGTTFDVMDEAQRQQTTKGIWMCPSSYGNTLVMDVEGTDGRERGEDQDFERKSALFSLASTEVLIVNLWEHQIGLYNGANMGLLKTVFEVNLGLFGGGGDASRPKPQEKTLILFVIRDHVGATPMSNLTATLTQDMEKIWASLSKPPHLADATLSSYFDLSFAALPHKILMPEKFESEVLELRQRFTDRSRSDYVFQPSYHKRIPADGVGFYMEGIWVAVTESFLANARIVRKPVEGGNIVEGLGALMREWLDGALGKFDRDASRYHAGVYQRKRQDLLAGLHSALSPLYLGQLKNLHKIETQRFSKSIVKGTKEPGYDFGKVVTEGTREARERFSHGAKEMTVDETDWEYDTELLLLDDDLRAIADRCRADETKKMVNAVEMWDQILTTYKDTTHSAEGTYLTKARGYNCSAEENEAAIAALRARSWLALRRKLEEQTSDASILAILRSAFEERFRYDDAGVPRVWRPEDDIEGAFKKAKDEIPMWIYGVLVVLGWNEAMAVLFNPLYFAMLLVLGASGYIVLQLGLAGPILQVTRTVLNEVRRIATDRLREAFAEVPEAQRILSHPVNATSATSDVSRHEEGRRGDLLREKVVEK
ncbi:protein SEY1 [Kwoniella sp. DSM 27419]